MGRGVGSWRDTRRAGRSRSPIGGRARAGFGALAIAVVSVVGVPTPADATSIFQVEFRHCNTLHVGYKHFPVGTVVHWSVSQHNRELGTGQFVTAPGPGLHFYSVKLPTPLDPHPKASVTFIATVDGQAFRMTVGRAPANPNKPLCLNARVTPSGSPIPVRLTNTTHPASPAPPTLAFTGNGPGALVGVSFVLMGAVLLLTAQPTGRHPRTKLRRRAAPWLYVTAVPPRSDISG